MYDLNEPWLRALLVIAILALPLKAIGLWRSARNSQTGWFTALLILNTLGILELIYLFYFSKPKTDSKD